jgi:hypothetical protein
VPDGRLPPAPVGRGRGGFRYRNRCSRRGSRSRGGGLGPEGRADRRRAARRTTRCRRRAARGRGRLRAGRRTEGQHAQQHHFQATAGIGRQGQVAAADEADLVVELHVLGRQFAGQLQHRLAVVQAVVQGLGHRLGQGHLLQQGQQLGQQAGEIGHLLGGLLHRRQHRWRHSPPGRAAGASTWSCSRVPSMARTSASRTAPPP